jgi:hypothetical protein
MSCHATNLLNLLNLHSSCRRKVLHHFIGKLCARPTLPGAKRSCSTVNFDVHGVLCGSISVSAKNSKNCTEKINLCQTRTPWKIARLCCQCNKCSFLWSRHTESVLGLEVASCHNSLARGCVFPERLYAAAASCIFQAGQEHVCPGRRAPGCSLDVPAAPREAARAKP